MPTKRENTAEWIHFFLNLLNPSPNHTQNVATDENDRERWRHTGSPECNECDHEHGDERRSDEHQSLETTAIVCEIRRRVSARCVEVSRAVRQRTLSKTTLNCSRRVLTCKTCDSCFRTHHLRRASRDDNWGRRSGRSGCVGAKGVGLEPEEDPTFLSRAVQPATGEFELRCYIHNSVFTKVILSKVS